MKIDKIIKQVKKGAVITGKKLDKGVSNVGKKIDKTMGKKIKVRKVLKGKKMVVRIPEHKAAEYVPLYFKSEMEDAKKSMFMS